MLRGNTAALSLDISHRLSPFRVFKMEAHVLLGDEEAAWIAALKLWNESVVTAFECLEELAGEGCQGETTAGQVIVSRSL